MTERSCGKQFMDCLPVAVIASVLNFLCERSLANWSSVRKVSLREMKHPVFRRPKPWFLDLAPELVDGRLRDTPGIASTRIDAMAVWERGAKLFLLTFRSLSHGWGVESLLAVHSIPSGKGVRDAISLAQNNQTGTPLPMELAVIDQDKVLLVLYDAEIPFLEIRDPSSPEQILSTLALSKGRWTHIAATASNHVLLTKLNRTGVIKRLVVSADDDNKKIAVFAEHKEKEIVVDFGSGHHHILAVCGGEVKTWGPVFVISLAAGPVTSWNLVIVNVKGETKAKIELPRLTRSVSMIAGCVICYDGRGLLVVDPLTGAMRNMHQDTHQDSPWPNCLVTHTSSGTLVVWKHIDHQFSILPR